ncbi:MAG: hypothetical protein IPJ68_02430 [Candidatus Moraniibacteriota bacterium]|nr:MAG: hypothetical protein IPJ68_02430 [Candidatus Moranbacteria bacterium]
MKYPLIILGAGAAFDYVEDRFNSLSVAGGIDFRLKPPLTKDLFHERFKQFIATNNIVSGIASSMTDEAIGDFEKFLTKIQNEYAPRNKERYQQLIALRLYLRDLFREISNNYFSPVNNYRGLIDRLGDYCGGNAIVVNFNYDLLFEKNLSFYNNSNGFQRVDDYISDAHLKVIKIHGAYNWIQIVDESDSHLAPKNDEYLYRHAERIHNDLKITELDEEIYIDGHYRKILKIGTTTTHRYSVPSLAIPITDKKNFVCPERHVKLLTDSFEKIDGILIIGWKAGDDYLVDLINKNFQKSEIPFGIVSPNANLTAEKFPGIKIELYKKGFTDFMRASTNGVESFFSL